MNTLAFKTLINTYPTSEALFAFLRSPEGGNLSVLIPEHLSDNPLALIHYVKNKSDMSLPHVEYFRSVIWNPRTNCPVCVAPSHGRKFSDLVDNPPTTSWIVEDFVDGVMINMFWDGHRWRLATRTRIDANGKFYGTRPFGDLFWEALRASRLHPDENFDKRYCYSFVMQHTEERIVVAPAYGIPKLFLVETTHIMADGTVYIIDMSLAPNNIGSILLERHSLNTLEDIKERVVAWGHRYGHQWQGLVVKTCDPALGSKRWKIRSEEYNEARHLRGNHSNRTYLWLDRWASRKFEQYVHLFPEEKIDAETVVERFKACTQELYELYQKVYRRREMPLGQTPQKYRKLLWDAHAVNKGAYFRDLCEFMNTQDTARKVWLVNYDTRYAPEIIDVDSA